MEPSSISYLNSSQKEKILVDVKECQRLFQEDQFKKKEKENSEIKDKMRKRKIEEFKFYDSLNLSNEVKKKIFQGKIDFPMSKHNPKFNYKIVQDPILGNIIMTEDKADEYLRDHYKMRTK